MHPFLVTKYEFFYYPMRLISRELQQICNGVEKQLHVCGVCSSLQKRVSENSSKLLEINFRDFS